MYVWIVIRRKRETENELRSYTEYVEPCKPSFSVKSVSQGLFQFEKAGPVSVCSIYDIHVL